MSEENQEALSRMQEGFKALERRRIVKQTIIAELEEIIPKSGYYKKQLDAAKTNAKRRLMTKRLKGNNKKVADLIMALERLDDSRGTGNELSFDTRRTETPSPTEESVD